MSKKPTFSALNTPKDTQEETQSFSAKV